MRIQIVSSLVVLCVLAFPNNINGRECYQCYHSTDSSSRNDHNCDEASKIYLRECTAPVVLSQDLQEFFTKEKYPVLNINNKEEELEFSCIVIDVELYNGKDNLTVRGCALKHDTGFDVNSPSSSSFKTYIYICNSDGCNDPHTGFNLESICKYFTYTKTVLAAAGVVVGAAGIVAATPIALGAAGFTASGIAGGSLAASAQAGIGTIAGGSIFATLQSIGAGGLALSSKALLGLVGGSAVGGMVLWFTDIFNSKMCN